MAVAGESEKYEVLETIGRGSFGIIRKVRRKADGHVLCRKEIQYIKMSQKEREQLHAEFSILNSLKHTNIVGYYHREHLKATQELFLYMEYCGGGDLSKEIQRLKLKNQLADEEYVWSILSQLILALYRCHYGVDPPAVGKAIGPTPGTKAEGLKPKNAVMILHRDLKPENGADNSVKLGDFGLSKLMQSHDFASTYVGTPFYMSPEICAAEKYTLHSDIWSLGCVMYELCARTQPFNAKTHFHLIQKIKEGRLDPLPSVYSQELQGVIKSCLNVNPLKRPDTAMLLNLPPVRLMRKEKEVVELGRILRDKEEHVRLKALEADTKAMHMQNDKEKVRAGLEASIRREWEVKANLEIARQVQLEREKLLKAFESEVQFRVKQEVERHLDPHGSANTSSTKDAEGQQSPTSELQLSSISTADETDFPSTTDLSSLSLESPTIAAATTEIKSKTPPQRRQRGPLARARTQFDSPNDVQMVDPSPMSIACLSLSPRRTERTQAATLPSRNNIFAQAAGKSRLSPRSSVIVEDEEDGIPDLPSPTRAPHPLTTVTKAGSNPNLVDPFKAPAGNATAAPAARPALLSRQKTAPTRQRLGPTSNNHQVPTLFPATAAEKISRVPSPQGNRQTTRSGFSPARKAPSKPASNTTSTTTTAHSSSTHSSSSSSDGSNNNNPRSNSSNSDGDAYFKAVMQRNLQQQSQAQSQPAQQPQQSNAATAMLTSGRTLVELAQARAGQPSQRLTDKGIINTSADSGTKENLAPAVAGANIALAAPVWDPEHDEMPSPFLARKGRAVGMGTLRGR